MRYREPLSVIATTLAVTIAFTQSGPAEAPAGFDDQTNGFVNQTQFDSDRTIFEERETIDDGLGPVYNAQACAECHQNPVTGGISQVTELRAGHFDGLLFVNHPGGSLINDRAIDPSIQERVLGGNEVRTFRTSLAPTWRPSPGSCAPPRLHRGMRLSRPRPARSAAISCSRSSAATSVT